MTFTLFRGVCSDEIYIPYVTQLVKIASVCRLCGSSVAYSYHIELFGKKDSQERLASINNKRSVGYNIE